MFEHTEDGMEEFAHDGDQSNHLGLAASSQMFIEGAPVGLAAKGDQGGHVEGAAQVDVAAFAEARLLVHGAARSGSDRCLPEGTAEFHTPSTAVASRLVARGWPSLRTISRLTVRLWCPRL